MIIVATLPKHDIRTMPTSGALWYGPEKRDRRRKGINMTSHRRLQLVLTVVVSIQQCKLHSCSVMI